jgi:DUF971 family protein
MVTVHASSEVEADLASLTVQIADGRTAALPAERLRLACKCAYCTRARIDGRFPAEFPGAAIVAVRDLGYGLNLQFSDGHDRGIYPHAYLATLIDVD